MPRYKHIDTSPHLIAVDLERQLHPGTFEHALNYLVDQQLDLSASIAAIRTTSLVPAPTRRTSLQFGKWYGVTSGTDCIERAQSWLKWANV